MSTNTDPRPAFLDENGRPTRAGLLYRARREGALYGATIPGYYVIKEMVKEGLLEEFTTDEGTLAWRIPAVVIDETGLIVGRCLGCDGGHLCFCL